MQDAFSKRYWWFGINNLKDRKPESFNHVIYPEIQPFLNEEVDTFEWPRQVQHHQDFYDQLQPGDSVLLWMGDGDYPDWGIIGFVYIAQVIRGPFRDKNKYFLKRTYIPEKSLKPYENNQPKSSEVTNFLYEIFGRDFKPLRTTFINIGKHAKRTSPVTIEKIYKQQFEKVLEYAKNINNCLSVNPQPSDQSN